LVLELHSLLLEKTTNDCVEVAIGFVKEFKSLLHCKPPASTEQLS
jgi:hypothetical protein